MGCILSKGILARGLLEMCMIHFKESALQLQLPFIIFNIANPFEVFLFFPDILVL